MDVNDLQEFKALGLPKIGQLGFIVGDMEESLPHYSSFYNVNSWFQPNFDEIEFKKGDETIPMDLNILFAFSGNVQIELIEPKGGKDNIYTEHLEAHGGGLHHLGFYVSNYDEKVKVIEALGIPVLLMGRFKTAGGGFARNLTMDTKGYCGTFLELTEVKLFGISIPQTEFFWNVGTWTGDGTKIRV